MAPPSFSRARARYSREMRIQTIAVVAGALVMLAAGPAAAGTITRVSIAPETVSAGTKVTITVDGTNPCGAAKIAYGESDGDAVTYAITGVPYSQDHVYSKPGTFTVTARGMGNCDGEVTTSITVTAPPQAAQPAPPSAQPPTQITSVDVAPSPGKVAEPVVITVNGSKTCTYEVHYGDGNAQQVTGELPQQFRHTYAKPDDYTVIVKPTDPCTGKFTQLLKVAAADAQPAKISRILISPSPVDPGQPVEITVEGSGTCGYTVEFGDGNDEKRSAALPDRVHHVYQVAGAYNVVARAAAPCGGAARARVDARQRHR
jgi:hypothetical protein